MAASVDVLISIPYSGVRAGWPGGVRSCLASRTCPPEQQLLTLQTPSTAPWPYLQRLRRLGPPSAGSAASGCIGALSLHEVLINRCSVTKGLLRMLEAHIAKRGSFTSLSGMVDEQRHLQHHE